MSSLTWDEFRFQLYPVDGRLTVRHLPDEHFQQRCQVYRVQVGGGSVHVWWAFHNGAKLPFARQHFRDNYRYQDDNVTPHCARVVLDFFQQGNVLKMEQPARSPDCNPIAHLWDELGRAITSMNNPPKNRGELCQALLDKWAESPVKRLQHRVPSMLQCLVAIIADRGGNIRYWPGIHKTAHAANSSNINKCHHKYNQIHIKQNSAHNT